MNMMNFRLKKFEVRLFTVVRILDDKRKNAHKITNVTWSQVCTKLLCFILISEDFCSDCINYINYLAHLSTSKCECSRNSDIIHDKLKN